MKTKKDKKQFCHWHETMETVGECSIKPTIESKPLHTPTPWITEVNGEKTRTPEEVAFFAGSNRDYVLRAVNSHEDLLAAVAQARLILSGPEGKFLSEAIAKAEEK